MTFEELLVKIGASLLSVVAILLVIYWLDKMAKKRAVKESAKFNKMIEESKQKNKVSSKKKK